MTQHLNVSLNNLPLTKNTFPKIFSSSCIFGYSSSICGLYVDLKDLLNFLNYKIFSDLFRQRHYLLSIYVGDIFLMFEN